jgi:hypothetical protein
LLKLGTFSFNLKKVASRLLCMRVDYPNEIAGAVLGGQPMSRGWVRCRRGRIVNLSELETKRDFSRTWRRWVIRMARGEVS